MVDLLTLNTSNSRPDFNDYGTTLSAFKGRTGAQTFSSEAQMQSSTSEVNGLQVGYEVFANNVSFPSSPTTIYAPVDLSLAAEAEAEDRGEIIPGINDDFVVAGPDLGAIERQFSVLDLIFDDGFED